MHSILRLPVYLAGASLLLLLAVPSSARAGACCVGSTTSEAGRLGPCEFFSAGIGTGVEARMGAWSRKGDFRVGSDSRLTIRWTGSLAVRPSRTMQLGISLPVLLQGKRVGDLDGVGGGPGDTTIWTALEPFEDSPVPAAIPLPDFGLAVTLPTGIPVQASTAPVGAGATGTGHMVVTPSMRVGRSGFKGSLYGGVSFALPLPRPGSLVLPGAGWEVALAGAWYAKTDLSLSLSGGLRGLTPGRVEGRAAGAPSLEPWLGAGMAISTKREGRVTLGVSHSIPAPLIGRSKEATVLFSLSVAYVTKRRPQPR